MRKRVSEDVFTNGLSRVHVVGDFQIGNVLLDLGEELFGRETHCGHIVGTLFEILARMLHELENRHEAILDVHHRKPCVLSQVAFIFAVREGFGEDLFQSLFVI